MPRRKSVKRVSRGRRNSMRRKSMRKNTMRRKSMKRKSMRRNTKRVNRRQRSSIRMRGGALFEPIKDEREGEITKVTVINKGHGNFLANILPDQEVSAGPDPAPAPVPEPAPAPEPLALETPLELHARVRAAQEERDQGARELQPVAEEQVVVQPVSAQPSPDQDDFPEPSTTGKKSGSDIGDAPDTPPRPR